MIKIDYKENIKHNIIFCKKASKVSWGKMYIEIRKKVPLSTIKFKQLRKKGHTSKFEDFEKLSEALGIDTIILLTTKLGE